MNKTIEKPDKLGFSLEKLANIRSEMEKYIGKGKFNGAQGLVECKGEIAYCESYGVSDTETKKIIKTDTIFRIYSMTKPITSVAAMMLYEEGKFSLDDPASKHIPEFEGIKVGVEENGSLTEVDTKQPMTIRHLLTHTSGLSFGRAQQKGDEKAKTPKLGMGNMNLEAMVKQMGKSPLLFQPGSMWSYSQATAVMGRLVEVWSGQTFDRFLEERIFQPLGMVDTAFYCPPEKADRLAGDYQLGPDKKVIPVPAGTRRDFTKKPILLSGGGGLVSTMDDYLRFFQMVLHKGTREKVQILRPETIDLMFENHIEGAKVGTSGIGLGITKDGFGLGFNRVLAPGNGGSMTHGWGGAAGTSVWVDPQNEMIGIWMIQIYNPVSGAKFRVHIYDAFEKGG